MDLCAGMIYKPRVTETEACIALNMVPGLGPVRLRALLLALGSPEIVLQSGKGALASVNGIGPDTAAAIAGWEQSVEAERGSRW